MKKEQLLTILSTAGVLFAGYLSFYRLFLGACPLNEPCTYVLGIPSCLIGFVLFSALLIQSLVKSKKMKKYIHYTSLAGIVFAAYSSIVDLFYTSCPGGCSYSLILPSCVYGLVFYITIFLINRKKK